MKMKQIKEKALLTGTLLLTLFNGAKAQSTRPDTLWIKYDNRFTANKIYPISVYDTIEFGATKLTLRKPNAESGVKSIGYPTTSAPGVFMFTNPGRYLYKPSSMNCDFTKSSSQWCFERSQESEHFVVFWEDGVTFDKNYILERAERAWDVYVNRLGFISPGNSKGTDNYKIIMRMYKTGDWVASGSGEDNAVGTLNLSKSAYQARGGHTVAHEVGHTFQYLTGVDNASKGMGGFGWGFASDGSGDNCFWEDCANWQGYKVYPERQFSDGEYFEAYMNTCHLNMLHEDARYNNCYYQDYLCQVYGQDFIGRIWRECKRPEDPVDAIRRLQNLSQDDFSKLMYECFAHMCTWDINEVRQYAQHRIGAHPYRLQTKTIDGEEWFQPSVDYCLQNYGYNITELKVPSQGTSIKVNFKGLAGESGYKTVNKSRAGWRWGLVTLMQDGTTQYGDMQSDTEASINYVIPEGAKRMWLVVMGAPTMWWHHLWDRYNEAPATNNEQWPYRVSFEGTRPSASKRVFTSEDFPEDYERRDTTVTVEATLARANDYSAVYVQYDTDAISEALGITTEQLHSLKCNASANPRFVAISSNGSVTSSTTTSTSSATVLGHWFNTSGNVCGYDNSAALYAELSTKDYQCKVGQYPNRLTAGKTYTIKQAVYYKVGTKTYKATIVVKLKVV